MLHIKLGVLATTISKHLQRNVGGTMKKINEVSAPYKKFNFPRGLWFPFRLEGLILQEQCREGYSHLVERLRVRLSLLGQVRYEIGNFISLATVSERIMKSLAYS